MQTTLTYEKSNPFKFLFILTLLCGITIAIIAGIDYANSHGPERHPGDAEQVRECLNKNGVLQLWANPTTGRRAQICQIGPTLFGVQIIQKAGDKWDELTAFLKPKMSRIEQVMQYMRNTGYDLLN